MSTANPGNEEILQTEPTSEPNSDSNIFLNLYNKIEIVDGEDLLRKSTQDILRNYYDFGKNNMIITEN